MHFVPFKFFEIYIYGTNSILSLDIFIVELENYVLGPEIVQKYQSNWEF